MGVELTPEEVDDFLRDGHTLIFTTIRKSGEPFATPMWYAYIDGSIYIRTLGRSAKVAHARRDPRVCCTVETGDAWVDLKAVIANCERNGALVIPELRDVLKTTRKFLIPLLEHLDAQGLTLRQGGRRVLRRR